AANQSFLRSNPDLAANTRIKSKASMQHVYSLEDADLHRPSVVTIGSFDGVHRGHQLLIQEVIKYAHSNDLVAAVLTFFPHPQMVLRGPQPGFYLPTPDEKAK